MPPFKVQSWTFGPLALQAFDYLVCTVLREVRLAALTRIGQHDRGELVVVQNVKPGYAGGSEVEAVSDIDMLAQARGAELFQLLLPGVGLRAEEDGLSIPAAFTGPHEVVLTFDPTDGSARLGFLLDNLQEPRASGVCIMVGVRINGQVVGAYILDMFSGELIRVAPGTNTVLRTTEDDFASEPLSFDDNAPATLAEGVLSLHRTPQYHSDLMKLLRPGVFGSTRVYNGGLGGNVLDLLTGRGGVVAIGRRPGKSLTPWDDAPTATLCQAAGVGTFWVLPDRLQEFTLVAPNHEAAPPNEHGILYVHGCYFEELSDALPVEFLPQP